MKTVLDILKSSLIGETLKVFQIENRSITNINWVVRDKFYHTSYDTHRDRAIIEKLVKVEDVLCDLDRDGCDFYIKFKEGICLLENE